MPQIDKIFAKRLSIVIQGVFCKLPLCFADYPLNSEPYNLAQQAGSFQVVDSPDLEEHSEHGKVIQQMVGRPPVDTCRPERMTRPVALIGNYQW